MPSSPEQRDARASVLRSKNDIAAALEALQDAGQKIVSFLDGGETLFQATLAEVDAARGYIVLAPTSEPAASRALLAQPRCIFSATLEGLRMEFVAGRPRPIRDGAGRITLDFPDVLSRWRRSHERSAISPGVPLHCTADSEGVMPFEGLVVDIGPEGLGFLIHAESISLEPGTVLRSCLIDLPGHPPCKADLEVCYSQPMVLGDGTHSLRSGCRFIDTSGSVAELIRFYLQASPREGDGDAKQDLI
jgi:hypothetical protein